MLPRACSFVFLLMMVCLARAWIPSASSRRWMASKSQNIFQTQIYSSSTEETQQPMTTIVAEELPYDYEVPEDAVIHIKPRAMQRLRELRSKECQNDDDYLTLRMGVRSGGCSGMSYVMDFCAADQITDDDQVDEYESDKIRCVVDAKSMLYLYGLELDFSTELIGGGFKFFNPNAEESCGCGSSFGV